MQRELKQTPFGVVDRTAFYRAAQLIASESGVIFSCVALEAKTGTSSEEKFFYRFMFSPRDEKEVFADWWNNIYSTTKNQLARSIALLLAYNMLEDYPDA